MIGLVLLLALLVENRKNQIFFFSISIEIDHFMNKSTVMFLRNIAQKKTVCN